MKTARTRVRTALWLVVFAVGALTPVAAILLKPQNYSFYMFGPAVPPTSTDRVWLGAANVLLVVAFVSISIAAVRLGVVAFRERRWGFLLLPVIVLLHPLLQPVFLENLDTYLNRQWRASAEAAGLAGMTESEVRATIGEPASTHPFGAGALWVYDPLPVYWFGSSCQVFFKDGHVTYFEANND